MKSVKVLANTVFFAMYGIFGVSSDQLLIERMVWIGGIYTAVVGLYSLVAPAPYGRYATSTIFTKFSLNASVGWMIQECWSAVIPIVLLFLTPAAKSTQLANIVAVSLFVMHYINRSFIYPFRLSKDAKPVPVLTAASAVVYTLFNGFMQGHHLLNVRATEESDRFFTFIGAVIFLCGMSINIYHDELLSSLRKTNRPGEKKEYMIPRGGLFDKISGANFFGEIVEWCGFALITRSAPQILFAIFSATFLGLRAVHHHGFYKRTFGDRYPKNRKAIIPFIL